MAGLPEHSESALGREVHTVFLIHRQRKLIDDTTTIGTEDSPGQDKTVDRPRTGELGAISTITEVSLDSDGIDHEALSPRPDLLRLREGESHGSSTTSLAMSSE